MTEEQTKQLAALITEKRLTLGLSMRQLCAQSGLLIGTVSQLEAGAIRTPQSDTIAALAGPLHVSVSDLYAAIGWLPANELPNFRPYMRAKFHELDDDAILEIERYVDELTQRIDSLGPVNGEDELND